MSETLKRVGKLVTTAKFREHKSEHKTRYEGHVLKFQKKSQGGGIHAQEEFDPCIRMICLVSPNDSKFCSIFYSLKICSDLIHCLTREAVLADIMSTLRPHTRAPPVELRHVGV